MGLQIFPSGGNGGVTLYGGNDGADFYTAGECNLLDFFTGEATTEVTSQPTWFGDCDYTWGDTGFDWIENATTTVNGSDIQVPSFVTPGNFTLIPYLSFSGPVTGRTMLFQVTRPGNWTFIYAATQISNTEFNCAIPWISSDPNETARIGVQWASYGTTTALAPNTVACEFYRHAKFA